MNRILSNGGAVASRFLAGQNTNIRASLFAQSVHPASTPQSAGYRTKGSKNKVRRSAKYEEGPSDPSKLKNEKTGTEKGRSGARRAMNVGRPMIEKDQDGPNDKLPLILTKDSNISSFPSNQGADTSTPFKHLPDPKYWYDTFRRGRGFLQTHRHCLANEDTAKKVVELLDLPGRRKRLSNSGDERLTIIEGYPGPGTITRQFLESDDVEKVIAMEDTRTFFEWLSNLLHDPTLEGKGSKLIAMNASTYHWETYTNMLQAGLLDNVESVRELRHSDPDYSQGLFHDKIWTSTYFIELEISYSRTIPDESPILYFITLPNTVHGEQLFAQLIAAIANRLWLFRFARISLAMICSEQIAMRCLAETSSKFRNRLSVSTQVVSEPHLLLDSSHFLPNANHFWPSSPTIGPRLPQTKKHSSLVAGRLSSGNTKQDQCLLLIEPKQQPLVSGGDADAYDYLTRNMFVLKAQTVAQSLTHMAPGAVRLLDVMKQGTHPVMREMGEHITIDPDTKVNQLSVKQFVALAKLFDRWPFRPAQLFEVSRQALHVLQRLTHIFLQEGRLAEIASKSQIIQ